MLSNHTLLYRAASHVYLNKCDQLNLHLPKCINSCSVYLMSILFASIPTPTLEKKTTLLQLSALFSPKIAESRECGRIESVLADCIVFCSFSGYIKRQKLWTYKKVMDASFLCLNPPVADLSRRQERQQKKRKTR